MIVVVPDLIAVVVVVDYPDLSHIIQLLFPNQIVDCRPINQSINQNNQNLFINSKKQNKPENLRQHNLNDIQPDYIVILI